MNKVELKKFAVEARRDLIEKVSLKAEQYGITKDNIELNVVEEYGQLIVNGREYPIEISHPLHTLERRLKSIGYEQLIEEVAYTWFNRIIAIFYMEVKGYLPEKVTILSSTTGKAEPDILSQYETMNLSIDLREIAKLKQEGRIDSAYKMLFVSTCNNLSESLPTLFEKINDYTELLLPDYLLDQEFIISKLVTNKDLKASFKEVEVIGWLYQYYNSESKDKIFKGLKKGKKVGKHEIPAATQFFTPKWIVQYLVENTLGQLWLETYPNSQVKEKMEYYLKPAEQTDKVKKKLEKIKSGKINLEELKIIDPCVGSGHILVYAFDLLYDMYKDLGYLSKDIPSLILEKNLYGLDIDERSSQMASFALMMRGREKSGRLLKENITPHIYTIVDADNIDNMAIQTILASTDEEKEELDLILRLFKNAKNIGSAIIPPKLDYDKYINKIESLRMSQITIDSLLFDSQLIKLKEIFLQAKILSYEYDIAITNPPYMGNRNMNPQFQSFADDNYKVSKSNMYAIFIERLRVFVKESGFSGSITQHSWMFLKSYNKFRNNILNEGIIWSLIHLGPRAFDDIDGEVVQTSAQIIRNESEPEYKSSFIRLVDFKNSLLKRDNLFCMRNRYLIQQGVFFDIPNHPIAYWASDQLRDIFKNMQMVGEIAEVKKGMDTGHNESFVRYWFEVNKLKTELPLLDDKSILREKKWVAYAKGGDARKWYGNQEFIVDWSSNGKRIKEHPKSTIRNERFNFEECLTWTDVGSDYLPARYLPEGFLRDNRGPGIFISNDKIKILLGFLCSNLGMHLKKIINPTLTFQVGNIQSLPISSKLFTVDNAKKINALVSRCINISKEEWNDYEVSWDFKAHPFIYSKNNYLHEAFKNWEHYTEKRFNEIKKNEEELNNIIINIYELKNEVLPEVENEKVTLRKADRLKDTKFFISYFIGCLMGRYSLDSVGLKYAGGDFNGESYKSYTPIKKGVIHLTEEQYFENDIIDHLKEFLSVVFNKNTVGENMKWLAESLDMRKNETPEDRLRRYFMNEFFKDHCQIYQKHPIYWLIDSGKQKGLRSLIYMHRYQPDTMATIRFEHLQEIQSKYQNEIEVLEIRLSNPDISASDRKNLEKSKESYQKKIEELQEFDKKLAVYANEPIDIDLDDGVKVNYANFQGILAKIK